MDKILVPVDFSDHTGISCAYAVELAKRTGAEIVLLHSFFEQIYFSDGGFATGFESGIMLTDEIILDFYKQKQDQLQELAGKLKEEHKKDNDSPLKITPIIETGDPQVQIITAIGKFNPDLVIMGSSGMGKKSFLSGSVCKKIMDHSDTPILAIPGAHEVKGFKNILYVTDIEQDDIKAINKLYDLFTEFNCHIHCLHMNVDSKDKDSEALMKELSENKGKKNPPERNKFHVEMCKDAKTSILDYIKRNEIELIAFIPHKKNFFSIFSHQDLTKEDLFDTGLPILGIQ
jgi:nucleotide-binding universal stress UspA family protein